MANFSSGDIVVFPAVNRSAEYVKSSRIISERLLTGLVNNLVDKNKFVIDCVYGDGANNVPTKISFNIDGYYFEINHLSDYVSGGSALYVKLEYGSSVSESYPSLAGDINEEFLGLSFSNDGGSDWFQLLDSSGKVPESSKLKYEADRISGYVKAVDGGNLDLN